VLFLFVFGIFGTVFFVSNQLKQDMTNLLQSQLLAEATLIANDLEIEIQYGTRVLETIASLITPEMMREPTKLSIYLESNPDLYLSFSIGVMAISTNGQAVVDYPVLPGRVNESYHAVDYFETVMASQKPYVAMPRLGKYSKLPELTLAVPIFDKSAKVVGVLVAYSNLLDSKFLSAINKSNTSDFVDRVLIVSPKDKIIVSGTDSSRTLQALPELTEQSVFTRFLSGFEGLGIYTNFTGVELVAAARNIPTPDWFVRVAIPTHTAFKPIEHLQYQVYTVGAVFTFIVGFWIWFVIRRAIYPLNVVTNELNKMSKTGKLLEVSTGHNDFEINQLTSSFNALVNERNRLEYKFMRLANIVETSKDAIFSISLAGHILSWNKGAQLIYGFSTEEIMEQSFLTLYPNQESVDFELFIMSVLEGKAIENYDSINIRKDGKKINVSMTISPLYDDNQRESGLSVIARDVTQNKLAEDIVWKQANFDMLTGLPNWRMFLNSVEQEIKKADRTSRLFVLLFIDLDRFKDVNDSLGHLMGDELLKQVAQRMQECVRQTDLVGRFAGDEFAIGLSEVEDLDSAGRIANNILAKLSTAFRLNNELIYISASIGITIYPRDGTDITTLLRNADRALYAAKHKGCNRFQFFIPSLNEDSFNRMRITQDLSVALSDNQFSVYYQPIIELNTGLLYKAEALIRWLHPELGFISPSEFIPIAEKTGHIVEIGNWVFLQATNQVRRFRDILHPEFQISINKSPLQFVDEADNKMEWFKHLEMLGLPGKSVVVEITEGMLMEARNEIIQQLLSYRDNGIQVAIDDFGTGYSSLSYLKKFDIDFIKIDQSFVRSLRSDSNDLILCEAITVMAHKLGLKVVAEGIESEEQLRLLRQVGCDYGQGYLFSKPITAEKFEKKFNSAQFNLEIVDN
jgi:diguanylate cyclase (GGDEF)-like protein/PAS domain S-box-containing protein